MGFDLTGRRAASLAVILLGVAGLSACTTTEGTNAFSDAGTFEREVMSSTARGLGLIGSETKADPTNNRGPLVLPKDNSSLPPPQKTDTAALLPADSAQVKVNSAGLSSEDLARLKNARIVDINTPDGRPLTQAEITKLTARMQAYRLNSKRSIFVPPEQYFELAGEQENLVCLAPNGDLVAVNDPSCPASIRQALLKNG